MQESIWIKNGTIIEDVHIISSFYCSGNNWQMYKLCHGGLCVFVLSDLYNKWVSNSLINANLFSEIQYDLCKYYYFIGYSDMSISSVDHGPYPDCFGDAAAFAVSLKQTRARISNVSFGDALYIENVSRLLPTYTGVEMDDKTVLGKVLTSGVEISIDNSSRIVSLCSWIPVDGIEKLVNYAGLDFVSPYKTHSQNAQNAQEDISDDNYTQVKPKEFVLEGRPELRAFIKEHIIDIIENQEKYKKMGIDFPSAIILHGPPGCGKTFAVERLIEYLDYPSFHIDSGSIGSPYIHDTSKKIAEVFKLAMNNAPSVLVIDEMEAFLSSREGAGVSGQHHVEEVAEFLRLIPEATKKHVLIIAMTNMIDSIDKAIIRRGRFDHIIEVNMPSKDEIKPLLVSLLKDLPLSDDIDYDQIASKLDKRPLSDVSYVVKEAGLLAAKNDYDRITNDLLLKSIASLPEEKKVNKIGFE